MKGGKICRSKTCLLQHNDSCNLKTQKKKQVQEGHFDSALFLSENKLILVLPILKMSSLNQKESTILIQGQDVETERILYKTFFLGFLT